MPIMKDIDKHLDQLNAMNKLRTSIKDKIMGVRPTVVFDNLEVMLAESDKMLFNEVVRFGKWLQEKELLESNKVGGSSNQ
jgi:hypothetical protein